ncbi:MAG: methionyl-tRNA formyltransferase, partial [Candidatus Binatia bacterium]
VRIVFMGTPAFAVPSLAVLFEAGHEVVGAVTQPDRPSGRGQSMQLSPVKRYALQRRLLVEQPERLRDPAFLERLRALSPELLVVAAYGKILPKAVLDLPLRGAINVHGSLLPKYRGAAPIQRALLAGEATTGITIMQMNERMDAGDILLQREVPIRPDDTGESLQARMAETGASALIEALYLLERGELLAVPQEDREATLAPMIRKEEGEIDWKRNAEEIERAVRAFFPWPSAYTRLRGKLLKILRGAVAPHADALPGTVVETAGEAIRIATGAGSLACLELQLEGKRAMSARELVSGRLVREKERLG